jgi:hypothetical protein
MITAKTVVIWVCLLSGQAVWRGENLESDMQSDVSETILTGKLTKVDT